MLPLRARVDLRAMAMKGYSAFPKAPALLEPHHQIVSRTLVGGYPSAEVPSVYSTAPADWAINAQGFAIAYLKPQDDVIDEEKIFTRVTNRYVSLSLSLFSHEVPHSKIIRTK